MDYGKYIVGGSGAQVYSAIGGLDETLYQIRSAIYKYRGQVAQLSRVLKQSSHQESAYAVWSFIKKNISYKMDPPGTEMIRTPARSWADRTAGVDCEDMTILAASLLLNMGYPVQLQIVAINGASQYGHIYLKTGPYAIDCVPEITGFNEEAPNITKRKIIDMNIEVLNGIGSLKESEFVSDFARVTFRETNRSRYPDLQILIDLGKKGVFEWTSGAERNGTIGLGLDEELPLSKSQLGKLAKHILTRLFKRGYKSVYIPGNDIELFGAYKQAFAGAISVYKDNTGIVHFKPARGIYDHSLNGLGNVENYTVSHYLEGLEHDNIAALPLEKQLLGLPTASGCGCNDKAIIVGLGAIERPTAVTEKLMAAQTELIEKYHSGQIERVQAAAELSKLRFAILLNATPDQAIVLESLNNIAFITPQGQAVTYDDLELAGLGNIFKNAVKIAKGAVKAAGQAAGNTIKKVVQSTAVVNPAFIAARAAVLLWLKANKKVARRLRPGYYSEAEARQRNLNLDEWRKLVDVVKEIENRHDRWGGKKENIKEAIYHGSKGMAGLGIIPLITAIAVPLLKELFGLLKKVNHEKLYENSNEKLSNLSDNDFENYEDEVSPSKSMATPVVPFSNGYTNSPQAATGKDLLNTGLDIIQKALTPKGGPTLPATAQAVFPSSAILPSGNNISPAMELPAQSNMQYTSEAKTPAWVIPSAIAAAGVGIILLTRDKGSRRGRRR